MPGHSRLQLLAASCSTRLNDRFPPPPPLCASQVPEAFGCGPAVVVSPIRGFQHNGTTYTVPLNKEDPDAGAGKLTQRFWDEITGIQYGRIPSDWSVVVDE